VGLDAESSRALKGVQYPFVVGERVLIMVNALLVTVTMK